jgi:hypothetical protein
MAEFEESKKIEEWGNYGIANGGFADCGTGDLIAQSLNS